MKLLTISFATLLVGAVVYLTIPVKDLIRSARDEIVWQMQAGAPDFAEAMVSMPDGVRLATDIYLPENTGKPTPSVLIRLPYGKRGYPEARFWVRELTNRGFVVVVQDMRGRHASEGEFSPYPNAGPDGYATMDWIIRQPWSNGKIGTIGCSALGESQFMLAAGNHPAHRAMVPIGAGGAIGIAGGTNAYFSAFEGGIPNLAASVGWFGTEGGKTPETSAHHPIDRIDHSYLPTIDIVSRYRSDTTDYEAFLKNFDEPDFWKGLGYVTGEEAFETPALIIDTWHDLGVRSTFTLADTLRRAGAPTNVIIAPGTHCGFLGSNQDTMIGDLAIAPKTEFDFVDLIGRFFAHHLGDGPAPDLPYLGYYMLVEDRWRSATDWPPPEAREHRFFLSGEGALEASAERVQISERRFISDPFDPVPSIGGLICCTGDPEELVGPVYQNALETRDDVLVYTSNPLEQPLRVAGPLSTDLRVSTDTLDTDIVVRLLDVDADGNALLVQEGALRLRYRDGFENPTLLRPGAVYAVTVEMRDIAYLFKKGHRLRLHVAGTSFPRLERNLNTGDVNYLESRGKSANITIHSSLTDSSTVTVYSLPD